MTSNDWFYRLVFGLSSCDYIIPNKQSSGVDLNGRSKTALIKQLFTRQVGRSTMGIT